MAVPLARPQTPALPAARTPGARQTWDSRLRRLLGQDWAPGLLFALPLVVLLLTIIAWPFARALWMSFHSVFGPRWGAWVGLRNYSQELEDPTSWPWPGSRPSTASCTTPRPWTGRTPGSASCTSPCPGCAT